MRVYVAGSSREVPRIRGIQAAIRELGGHITFDWTPSIERAIRLGISEEALADNEAEAIAHTDYEGVFSASTLFLAAPEAQTKGAWCELGFAHGIIRTLLELERHTPIARKLMLRSSPRVVISGPRARQSLFTRWGSPNIFLSDSMAIEHLADEMAHGRESEIRKAALSHLVAAA